jgi:hypothetical protein
MKLPGISNTIDERFLEHRRRSSSLAGIFTAALALLVFEYRLLVHSVVSWDLLAVSVAFVVLKLTVLVWYRLRD